MPTTTCSSKPLLLASLFVLPLVITERPTRRTGTKRSTLITQPAIHTCSPAVGRRSIQAHKATSRGIRELDRTPTLQTGSVGQVEEESANAFSCRLIRMARTSRSRSTEELQDGAHQI